MDLDDDHYCYYHAYCHCYHFGNYDYHHYHAGEYSYYYYYGSDLY